MEETVKQRLIKFIKFKSLSQAKFEKVIGVSNGFVNNISKSIGVEKAQRISNIFPELNIGWLLTGEGEMLKEEEPTIDEEIQRLEKLIEAQSEAIRSQKLLIAMLQEKIETLQRAIAEEEGEPL